MGEEEGRENVAFGSEMTMTETRKLGMKPKFRLALRRKAKDLLG